MSTGIDTFKTEIVFRFEGIGRETYPKIRMTVDDEIYWSGVICGEKILSFSRFCSPGLHRFEIELYDKPETDSWQALRIVDIKIGGIQSSRFIHQGQYIPRYPEPWATKQCQQGHNLEKIVRNTDYLGWNGIWRLELSIPVYTWIHEVENLGWIYD